MWKIQNFSVIQILREIKIGRYRVSKSAILFDTLRGSLDFQELLPLCEAEIYTPNQQSLEPLKWQKWQV